METEKSLVRVSEVKLPKFVEDAYETIEGMKQFAGMLLDSKLVPDHFYEKGVDNKPDYTKGKVPAVVVVLLQAQQLAIPPMTALQHVIPVNGLLSIKGDLAKTMIFASGKLKKDSWKETVTGSIESEDMVVTITATREDNGLTLTRTFSVDKAKRMSLWITSTQINAQDGWKWKKSAWYKTPDRMINYRCLGNIARDLFSDVLLNMYTTEEAVDIQRETAEVIETDSGAKITIPDKEHAKHRSSKMTDRVADKISDNKFGAVDSTIADAEIIEPGKQVENNESGRPVTTTESPFKAEQGSVEYMDGKPISRGGKPEDKAEPLKEGQLTLDQWKEKDTKELLKIINADTDMIEAMGLIPGKNTSKKLSGIIFAHQGDKLTEHVAPYLSDKNTEKQDGPEVIEQNAGAGIQANKDFENQGPAENKNADILLDKKGGNKYGLEIPAFDKGDQQRDFATMKQLFNALVSITPKIDNLRFLELKAKTPELEKHVDREQFCKFATVEEINLLLNAN